MRVRKKKSLLDQASEYVERARPQVESAVATALEAVEDFVETTAKPALADAYDKAGPALADARDKAAPVVAASAAKASKQTKKLAQDAKLAADSKVAQVKGEKPKKGSKLKKVAIFAAIAGAVGFVAKKLQGDGKGGDNWQSSYVPTPAPSPSATAAASTAKPATRTSAKKTDDAGGAAPDEAIADNAEEPHEATTPDEPADVVEVKPRPAKKATKATQS